jgi:hypothetical protein
MFFQLYNFPVKVEWGKIFSIGYYGHFALTLISNKLKSFILEPEDFRGLWVSE